MARIALACLLGISSWAHAQPPTPQAIEALVKSALKEWQVPGLALAIVHEDRLIFLRRHGVKELGKPRPVTPDTVFPVASCSKPFTSLAIALLVDEGKLAWDDPVKKYVPFFRLKDPLADANATLRDLLTHRTGVGSHELLWYKAPWDLEERIRKIGKVELESSFRSSFHYQVILFGTAGYAAGKAAGTSWQDLVQRRIFDSLEMKAAFPVFPGDEVDLAVGHRKFADGIKSIPRYPLDRPDPAGSIHASARDLAKFLRFQLGDGTWQGKRLLAANTLAEMHMPQIVIRREGFARVMNPESLQLSYGLGWIVQDYRGKLMVLHGGAIDGFRAHFTLVPQLRLGIVLVNNLDRTFMNLALSNTLVDRFLGAQAKDWNAYYLDIQAQEEAEEKERAKALRAKRKPGTKPTYPLQDYAGQFQDEAYGTCTVTLVEGRLVWSWGNLRCSLEHFQNDKFLANSDTLIDAPAEFRLGKNGGVEALTIIRRVFRKE